VSVLLAVVDYWLRVSRQVGWEATSTPTTPWEHRDYRAEEQVRLDTILGESERPRQEMVATTGLDRGRRVTAARSDLKTAPGGSGHHRRRGGSGCQPRQGGLIMPEATHTPTTSRRAVFRGISLTALASPAPNEGTILDSNVRVTDLGYSPGGSGRLRGLPQRSQMVTEWVRWGPL
jgi:hypothetical protein